MSAYEKDVILASGIRCVLSNRLPYGISALKLGTFSRGKEGDKTSTLADFSPPAIGGMENNFLANTDMEHAGRYPFSLDFTKRSIRNQNILWAMVFRSGHYTERAEALGFLSLRREECPEVFSIPFLASIWERMTIDYIQKVMEGVRRLTQLGSKSDGL